MTGLLFPGQGAQAVGMGKALAERFPAAAEVFRRADAALGFAISRLCFEGPIEELTKTDVSQPAIFTTSVAALAALESAGRFRREQATCAAGLSLGEYTALHAAGSLGFEEGLKLVRLRGEAMQAASAARPSSMASIVGLDEAGIAAACEEASAVGIVSIANKNAPGQIVIAGELAALEAAEKACVARGARRAIRLQVAGAFHSEVMRPAADALARALETTKLEAPRVPFFSNVTGAREERADAIRRNLAAQVCAPVLWEASMRAALAAGTTQFVELAPGSVLAGLLRKIDPAAKAERCESPDDVAGLGARDV